MQKKAIMSLKKCKTIPFVCKKRRFETWVIENGVFLIAMFFFRLGLDQSRECGGEK